jgi:hypothetical protein
MKYLKNYKLFNEALKPSQFRKYVKAFDKERYDEIFKELGNIYEHDRNYYRIYIPVQKEKASSHISQVHKLVDQFLDSNGLEIVDYVAGTAKYKKGDISFKKNDEITNTDIKLVGDNVTPKVYTKEEALKIASDLGLDLVETSSTGTQSICRIINYDKYVQEQLQKVKTVKIGQILQRLGNNELGLAFTSDQKRKDAITTENEQLMVVISRHPYDIAGSDTDRDWTNCMTIGTDKSNRLTKLMDDLEGAADSAERFRLERTIQSYKRNGSNVKYLIQEVKKGSLISYLIRESDKNIEKPLGVLNIKPYPSLDGSEILLKPSRKSYGVFRPEFNKTVIKVLDEYFNSKLKSKMFKIDPKVYSDTEAGAMVTKLGDMNIDELKQYSKYFGIKPENIEVESDGSISIVPKRRSFTLVIDLSRKGITEIAFKFNIVKGVFMIDNNRLTSLKNSPKIVENDFIISDNEITNLSGGPEEVGGNYICRRNNVSSLEGITGVIGGMLDLHNNKLTSLIGCPKIKASLIVEKNLLTTLEGSPKIIPETFNCSGNSLPSLVGGPEKVGSYYCSRNELNTLAGSPKTVKKLFDCSDNRLYTLLNGPKSVGDFFCHLNPVYTIYKLFVDSFIKEKNIELKKTYTYINIVTRSGEYDNITVIDNALQISQRVEIYKKFVNAEETYNFIDGSNIIKSKFEKVCQEVLGIETPEKVEGYKYI